MTPSSSQGPREKVSIVKFGEYDGEAGLRIRSTAEDEASPLEKDNRSSETGRRSDPTNARPSEPAPSRTQCTRVEAGSSS